MRTTTVTGLPQVDGGLEEWLRTRLDEVEKGLASAVASSDGFVTEAARYLLDAGGKRFRPLVTLLAAQFGDREVAAVIQAALVVEITHVATLYHDDVMDEATLRRGAPSAHTRWNNTVAILTGDYLLAQSARLAADLGPECVRIQAHTFARLVEGQLRETVGPAAGEDALEHYLSVVADKTASLISTSARYGALMAGAGPAVIQVLTDFGEKIGVAFQLSDDVLDVAGDSTEFGKTPGTDLREGVPTLPVLLARQSSDPADARLRELLSEALTDDVRHAEALALLRCHPAMDTAREVVRKCAEDARATLEPLPDVAGKDALAALCDHVLLRTH